MKFAGFVAFALCLALGACSSLPSVGPNLTPVGPSVTATAGSKVTEQKFASDVAACRARAQAAMEAATAADQAGRQNQYDSAYSDCILERGYKISQPVAR